MNSHLRLLKALGEEVVIDGLRKTAGAEKGDAVLIVAGKPKTVAASLGALRNEVARATEVDSRESLRALVGH